MEVMNQITKSKQEIVMPLGRLLAPQHWSKIFKIICVLKLKHLFLSFLRKTWNLPNWEVTVSLLWQWKVYHLASCLIFLATYRLYLLYFKFEKLILLLYLFILKLSIKYISCFSRNALNKVISIFFILKRLQVAKLPKAQTCTVFQAIFRPQTNILLYSS